jgi:hypothetical protein
MKLTSLSALPILLSGCAATGYTIHQATQPVTLYRHEKVDRIEKAVATQDGKLLAFLQGKIAGASKPGPFTVTIPCSESKSLPLKFDLHTISLPRSAVTEGWPAMEEPRLLPVSGVRIVLPDHQSAANQPANFPGSAGVERTLYVVWNERHDGNLEFVYVLQDPNPKRTFFALETKKEIRSHKYSLLLLLPVAVVADVVMSPVYGFMWLSGYRG